MRFALDLSIAQRPRSGNVSAPPVPTDSDITGIGSEGWRAGHQDPETFDPVSDPSYVLVTRNGYNDQGEETTFEEALVVTTRVRQPYPNEDTLTPGDVALSDYVYAGDTTVGFANNSAQPYPKPQALWLNHDCDVATGSLYRVRMAVAHAHARRGRPVAAVRFIASDGTNTVEVLSTDTDLQTYAATGLSVPHFYADLDLSGLEAGALITVDAEIRPWVGTPFLLSTDAEPYPSVNLTVLKVLNDHDGSYGTAFAYVAPGGDDGTGFADSDASAAEAAPFATVGAAAAAIEGYNAAEFGRTSVSGGVIRLQPGVHTHATLAARVVTETPLIIEAADPAQKAATVYQDAGVSVVNGLPDKVKFRNLTLRRNAAGNVIFLDSAAFTGSANMLVTEGCTWDDGGLGGAWNAWVYRVGRFWNIDCDGVDNAQCRQFSTDFKACICLGSGAGSLQDFTYHAVGCKDLAAKLETNPIQGNMQPTRGDFFGWNHFGQPVSGTRCLFMTNERAIDDRGIAIVGNVFEHYGGTTGPVLSISADGVTQPALNVTLMCNTVVGTRTNLLYQDLGSAAVQKQGRCRFNVDLLWNCKDDSFLPPDGNRTGNWAFQYRVGFQANGILQGSNKGTTFGPGDIWLGEIGAFGDVSGSPDAPLAANWADDQSFGEGGAGDGDYTPGPGHALPTIPPGLAPYGHDQKGRTIADNGTAVAGALQP